jgi:hypothetical protein
MFDACYPTQPGPIRRLASHDYTPKIFNNDRQRVKLKYGPPELWHGRHRIDDRRMVESLTFITRASSIMSRNKGSLRRASSGVLKRVTLPAPARLFAPRPDGKTTPLLRRQIRRHVAAAHRGGHPPQSTHPGQTPDGVYPGLQNQNGHRNQPRPIVLLAGCQDMHQQSLKLCVYRGQRKLITGHIPLSLPVGRAQLSVVLHHADLLS